LEFVATCGQDGTAPVPVEERVAVFDDDGTLWCEKPVAIQLDFILRRFVEMAEADPALRHRQPWKAGYERDHAWFNAVLTEHNAGDDHNVRTLAAGVLAADAGIRVRTSRHEPTRSCAACSARARLPRMRQRCLRLSRPRRARTVGWFRRVERTRGCAKTSSSTPRARRCAAGSTGRTM
jgi:hypothetical protein